METLCRILVLAITILQLNSQLNYKRCSSATECSNTSISKTLIIDRVWCEAAGSCSNSTITNMNLVTCRGEFSCQSTSLQSISQLILFDGAYSGYNSVINATANYISDTLTISYLGYYSGYGSKLVCGEGISCTINCQRLGCYGLDIECLGDNNCLVLNGGNCSTDPGIQSIIPSMLSQPSYPSRNAALCNAESTIDEYICNGIINASSSQISVTNSWICNEESSCSSMAIDNANNVYCSAVFGCEGSNISNVDNLYCSGFLSCRNVYAVNVTNVYCSGVEACISYTTFYNATNVYFIGHESWSWQTDIIVDTNQISNIYIYSTSYNPNQGLGDMDINCLEGSTCMISCGIVVECVRNTATMLIDLHCFPGSNCTVDCSDCQCNKCPNVMDGYYNELEAEQYVNLAEECENTDQCSSQWDKIQWMWILAVLVTSFVHAR